MPRAKISKEEAKARAKKADKFRRRKLSINNKGAQLKTICGANCYFFFELGPRWYEFTTKDAPDFPPTREEIVCKTPAFFTQ